MTEKKEADDAVPAESDHATASEAETATEITESTGVEATESAAAGDGDDADADDAADAVKTDEKVAAKKPRRKITGAAILVFGIIPLVALLLAAGAGYLRWEEAKQHETEQARIESLQVAKDSTIKLLSYKPDTVETDLGSAKDLLTGDFRDSYNQLINDVVIPGAKEKQISAVANVPAIASVSADPNKAVVLVFVNQTVIVGQSAPTATASSVRVTLQRVGDHWLISEFDPV